MRSASRIVGATLCVWGMIQGVANGQAIPPVPTPPPVPATVPATPAAPAPFNIWTALCPPPGSCDKCKQKCCDSFIGQFLGAALAPMRMATGGLAKPCCPTISPAALAMAADTPAGAAARIKQEEADAKARRLDVRYLGTVDCNRYPEAEKALIKALRTDRNECVRWEAAMALGNGCCCTRNTTEALFLTATGSDRDGNPIETSPRVKDAAMHALTLCEARGVHGAPEPPEKAPIPPELKKLPAALGQADQASPKAPAGADLGMVPAGQRGILQIFMRRVQH